MNKLAIVLLILIFPSSFAQTREQAEEKIAYHTLGSSLPVLRIVDTASKEYTAASFSNDASLFLFMFNPTCGHCVTMAQLLCAHIQLFDNQAIVFMAGPQMMPYMAAFYQETGIGQCPQIIAGVDSADAILQLFNYNALPQLNIYNRERKLVRVFNGDVPVDSLTRYPW